MRCSIGGLAVGALVIFGAIAEATPPEDLTVSEWADKHRQISAESGSPHAGQWSTDRAPYLREPMDCCGVNHPSAECYIAGSAQSGKSEILINAEFHMIDTAPRSSMIMLPSLSKVQAYNREKWEPNVEVTERVALKVMGTKSRSKDDSVTNHKRFRGGFLKLVSASTAKELQSSTIGFLILEEPTDYPFDADGRGDPIEQGKHRLDAWGDDGKVIGASTTGEAGSCRITSLVEAGDLRRYYVPCPHCGGFHTLRIENMLEDEGRPVFVCPCCGGFIEETALMGMLRGGAWIKTFVSDDVDNPAPPQAFEASELEQWRGRSSDGRYPSFHFWQAYSPFSTWRKIWKEWREAKESPEKLRTFYQQVLAEPYEPAHDRPDWQALRDAMVSPTVRAATRLERGQVPDWACVLCGSADQQGDRLEWAVWAFGPGRRAARIDWGAIPISPADPTAWAELARVAATEYEGPTFAPRRCDRFCVDTGGLHTTQAYRYAHAYGIKAIKGKPNDPDAPPMSLSGTKGRYTDEHGRKRRGVPLYLIGTHLLKKSVYHGLNQTMLTSNGDGSAIEPGSLFFTPDSSDEDYKQITAESLIEEVHDGRRVIKWKKSKEQANEQLDLAVYALADAIAFGIDRFSSEQWHELYSARMKDPALVDMGPLEAMMHQAEPEIATRAPAPRGAPSWAKRMREMNKNV